MPQRSPLGARARANVALVKYWGKRDAALNLPAAGSISLTLDGLEALAWVSDADGIGEARYVHGGRPVADPAGSRMAAFLDGLARSLGSNRTLRARTRTNFPVAAGLASSAAIYCAVSLAAVRTLGVEVSPGELSRIARRGSGSACRSVFGGLVEWTAGTAPDGSDSVAHPLVAGADWPLAMVVAITSAAVKKVASRDAMEHVAQTSPLYPAWVTSVPEDLAAMRAAIERRDLASVGRIAEENCLRMHATCIAARPPVLYWAPATLAVMDAVRELRQLGLEAYFTIDAGPQVKVLCLASDRAAIAAALRRVPGVVDVLVATAGAGVEAIDADEESLVEPSASREART